MVKVRVNMLFDQGAEDANVNHVAGVRGDLSLDTHLEFIVVSVKIGIVARTENLAIPGIGMRGIVEAMSGVEVSTTDDDGAGHRRNPGGWRDTNGVASRRRRRRSGRTMRGGTIEARGDSLGALSASSVFPVGPDVGRGMWAHPRTRWLDNVDSPPSSGLGYNTPHAQCGQWNRTLHSPRPAAS